MRRFFLFITTVIVTFCVFAQDTNSTVAISHGTGLTKEDAERNALRSAIEQTFGVFLSSSTQILNDSLISDEIATLTSGNIKSFEVISSEQFSEGQWGVTVKADISLSSLENFVSSKGYDIQLNSKLFALNMRQQEMNEIGEIKVLSQSIGFLHNHMQIAYDYKLEVAGTKNFKSVKGRSDLFELPMKVTAIPNTNFYQCMQYLINTIEGISMPKSEIKEYKKLGKEVIPLHIKFRTEKGENIVRNFRLRTRQSGEILSLFFNLFNFYSRLYEVNSGIDVQVTPGVSSYQKLYKTDFSCSYKRLSRSWNSRWFLKNGYQTYNNLSSHNGGVDLRSPTREFTWVETRALIELENMSNEFNIEPLGVVLPFKYGGIMFYDEAGHGKVLCVAGRFGFSTLYNKTEIADKINQIAFNGFNDWRSAEDSEVKSFSIHCQNLQRFNHPTDRDKLSPFYHLFNLPWVSSTFEDCLSSYDETNQTGDYDKLKHTKDKYKFTKYSMGKDFTRWSENQFLFPYIIEGNARYDYYDKNGNLKFPMWTYLIREF